MFFEHIYDKSLSQNSYVIGCQDTEEAIVIDPKRDIDTYLNVAKSNNLTIKYVAETHIHADFLCGSRELATATDAPLYLSDEGDEDWQYEFLHKGIKDGAMIKVGNLELEVMHTPGHTPESVSFLLTDHPATDKPTMIFTGDFVFVGDVGRPDLLEEAAGVKDTKVEGAQQMFRSLKRFVELPDYIQVWPGHGAGSACGKSLGAVPSSTVGYEKFSNWALQYMDDKQGFVDSLLADQPEPPKYFAMMKKLNKVERPLRVAVPQQTKLTKARFLSAYNKGIKVIDTRSDKEFTNGFIPRSINIQDNKSLSTWAGWVLDYDEQFMLVAEDDQIEDVTRKLMRIGLDNIYGYINNVEDLDIKLNTGEIVGYDEVKSAAARSDAQIVDVRSNSEYKTNHINGADHNFIGTIEDNLDEIDNDKEIIVHCQTGTRATVAYSLLRRNGFTNVKNYAGGMQDWHKNQADKEEKETIKS